jgi:predicted RNA methylase
MNQLQSIDLNATSGFTTESEVEAYADLFLRSTLNYHIKHRKTGCKQIDKHWPSKSKTPKSSGFPDVLVYTTPSSQIPFCVWENKEPSEPVATAIDEARFYIEGLHIKKPGTPNLPRLAAGFNGSELRVSYFNHEHKWLDVKVNGNPITQKFPLPKFAINGISSNGNFMASSGTASSSDLRKALPSLKTIYRSIPILSSGRCPIDFTVALLTLKMLVEEAQDWGVWAEQPGLILDAQSDDHAIGERFKTLANRVLSDPVLKGKYGDIFHFQEQTNNNEDVAFDFVEILASIPIGNSFFVRMFKILDNLPPLHGADFDVFGEVYQSIGDDATKKALGEFFTGRHIISAVVPVLFERAGVKSFDEHLAQKKVADIASGTGGFLTETLRFIRKKFGLNDKKTASFAASAFYGYDLSSANASRARVNMYFAGDGFSVIQGGVDSLSKQSPLPVNEDDKFDFILTNPPYGSSSQYQRLEEAFLTKMIDSLKQGAGWGLIVVPTGTLENPRSSNVRFNLLKKARVTDIISLPSHAFAPYTQQRTGIIIFERRNVPIQCDNWNDLLDEIQHEEISMFVVDNDGFANSDKRYETSRVADDGEWLHNDLKPWINNKSGKLLPSKLFSALIHKKQPLRATNEFGDNLGEKYKCQSIADLFTAQKNRGADKSEGIELLPDTYLRPEFRFMTFEDFKREVELVEKKMRSKVVGNFKHSSIRAKIKQLLATRISIESSTIGVIDDLFEVKKGNQGLTEEVIYNYFDKDGLPVYGGGESAPKYFVKSSLVTKHGNKATIYKGPAIVVSMDGSSGAVRVVSKGKFVCNHHAAVLKLKKGFKIDLNFIAQQIEGGLRSLASNKKSSATLTKPSLEGYSFQLTTSGEQIKNIGKLRKTLFVLNGKLN